jgi:hypothetical protein
MMRPLGRPIGVWIATAYLLVLQALVVLWLMNAPTWGGSLFIVQALAAFLPLLSTILLLFLNRWAVLTIGALTAFQVASYVAYLGSNPSHEIERIIERMGSANTVVYVYSIQYNVAPLVLLAVTVAVLLYTAWLWRRGVLT